MQGHGSACDYTFIVLLHIALCMCIAFFVCLPGGAFCFASHPISAQIFHPKRTQNILRNAICRSSRGATGPAVQCHVGQF